MSLAIDIDKVYAVLLADGWHQVADDSFELDAYEYIHGGTEPGRAGYLRFGGGEGTGAPSTGFMFTEQLPASTVHPGSKTTLKGPISSIVAVREKR